MELGSELLFVDQRQFPPSFLVTTSSDLLANADVPDLVSEDFLEDIKLLDAKKLFELKDNKGK